MNGKKTGDQKYFPDSWAHQWVLLQIFFIVGYILIIVNFNPAELPSEIWDVASFFVIEMFITAYGLRTLKEMKKNQDMKN